MTVYQQIQEKIDLLKVAASRTSGVMQEIWLCKAKTLEIILATISIDEAMEVVHG